MLKALMSIFKKKRPTEIDPVAAGLMKQTMLTLDPQLLMLGFQPKTVPMSGTYISGRSRGYLLGAAEATLQHNLRDKGTEEWLMFCVSAAFVEAFGEIGHWALACDTLDEFQAGNTDVMKGAERAHAELSGVYSGLPNAVAMGFWQFNNGIADS